MSDIPRENTLLGIFDSGVGGFSVYKKIRNITRANCIYYGDCARAPYGNRDEAEIVQFIKDDIMFLQEKGVTHFVNACNSMSVLTTNKVLSVCDVSPDHYIDMIRAFELHAEFPVDAVVLVAATKATIRSGVYQDVLAKKGIKVEAFVYEDLAGAIESNESYELLSQIVSEGVGYAVEIKATHMVYACTHYPLVNRLFVEAKEMSGWQGEFVDPAIYVANEVKSWGLLGETSFVPYSSKDTPAFITNVIKFL